MTVCVLKPILESVYRGLVEHCDVDASLIHGSTGIHLNKNTI